MQPSAPILQAEKLCFGYLAPPAPLLFDQFSLALPPGVTWLGGGESSGKTGPRLGRGRLRSARRC